MVAWWNPGLPGLVFSPEAPIHARIEALERLNRDTRLLVLDQTLVECQSARDALAGDGTRLSWHRVAAARRLRRSNRS